MITIEHLHKGFGLKKVLVDVNLTINDGDVLGLVGINGAGKSTLLRTICGVYKEDFGSIKVDGVEVYENENIKKNFFFLPDEPFYTQNATPEALLDLYSSQYKVDKTKYYYFLNIFKINPKGKLIHFSKGMKRQTFISLAFAIHPKYLILDEAFDGLDPLSRLIVKRELVSMITDNKTTVIISSHSLRELEDICDSFAILDKNHIVANGNLVDELDKIHKYQIAFNNVIEKDSFPSIYKSFQASGRVVKIVSLFSLEEVKKELEGLNPVFIDELTVNFEEMFETIVDKGGYLR